MPLITLFGQFGTNDFIEYWTAFRLLISQTNPYDPALMQQLQQTLGWSEQNPLMMWNPPWLLVIMAPILMLDFPQAATAWLLLNLVLLASIIFFCLDLIGFSSLSRLQRYLSIPITLSFFPLYTSLAVGQLGVLLAFAFIGAIWSIIQKRRFFGTCCLALWTVKIHLFIPIAVFLFLRSLRNHELWTFFIGALLVLGMILLETEYYHPGAIHQRSNAFSASKQSANVIVVERWESATFTCGARLLFSDGDHLPVWLMFFVPAAAIITTALVTIRLGSRLGYLEGSFLSALFSMTLGPFGWVFDFTILLPGYLTCVVRSLAPSIQVSVTRRVALITPLLFVQLFGWICRPLLKEHHLYMWFPPMLSLATAYCLLRSRYPLPPFQTKSKSSQWNIYRRK